MLILGQKSYFLGHTIFKVPQPNWYYCEYTLVILDLQPNYHFGSVIISIFVNNFMKQRKHLGTKYLNIIPFSAFWLSFGMMFSRNWWPRSLQKLSVLLWASMVLFLFQENWKTLDWFKQLQNCYINLYFLQRILDIDMISK